MKKIYKIFNLIICVTLSILSLVLIYKTADTQVFASTQVTITFDINKAHLGKYLDEEYLPSIQETVVLEKNQKIDFPTFTGAISELYYYPTWYCDGSDVDIDNCFASKDCVFKAEWKPIEYTIYYNNISQSDLDKIAQLKLDSYSIEKQIRYYIPTKENYIFVDYYSSNEFLTDEIEIYTDKYARGDKTIYAKWRARDFNINYNTDAYNPNNPPTYNVESPTFNLETPTKQGHIFVGWYLDSDFNDPISQIAKGHSGNLNLYPKWELEKYNVTYNLPDGEKQQVVVEYGKDASKPNYKTDIFHILQLSKSNKNITEDTQIDVKVVSIWYVYVIALFIIIGICAIIFIVNKKRKKNRERLKEKYQLYFKKGKKK